MQEKNPIHISVQYSASFQLEMYLLIFCLTLSLSRVWHHPRLQKRLLFILILRAFTNTTLHFYKLPSSFAVANRSRHSCQGYWTMDLLSPTWSLQKNQQHKTMKKKTKLQQKFRSEWKQWLEYDTSGTNLLWCLLPDSELSLLFFFIGNNDFRKHCVTLHGNSEQYKCQSWERLCLFALNRLFSAVFRSVYIWATNNYSCHQM